MAALQLHPREFQAISRLMYEACGLSFADNKLSLLQSRLGPRIQRLGLGGFDEYLQILQDESQAVEFQMAVDLLTTNETYFFREPKHYALLEQELPRLGTRGPLRLWSAAASFGDEAYSLAMLLSDLETAGRVGKDWSILATDISRRVLLSAKEGIYPADRLRGVSPQHLKRYCLRGEGDSAGQIKVQDKLRSRVQFGQLNLCQPIEDLGSFDVIMLRNVLIYFDAATKTAVVDRVLQFLKPGGLFFIGTAEGRVPCATPLVPVIPGAFRKAA